MSWLKKFWSWLNRLLAKAARVKMNPQVWAQSVHFLLGHLAVLWTAHLGGNTLIASCCVTAVSAVIEFWYDTRYEGAGFWNNFTDWSFYNGGAWSAYLILKVI